MQRRRRRHLATVVAATLLVAATSPAALSRAAPTRDELAQAKAKLADLNLVLDHLVEQYNQANVALESSQAKLTQLQTVSARAAATADAAQQALDDRVVESYKNSGSGVEVLLGAQTLADFADRLTFLSDLVHLDSDAASLATKTRGAALQAAAEVGQTIALREAMLKDLAEKRSAIEASIQDQQALVVQIAGSVAKAEAAAKEEARRQEEARAAAASLTTTATSSPSSAPSPPPSSPDPAPTSSSGGGGTGGGGGTSGPSAAALTAVRAAYSVLGVPYLYGGASPSTGFDCSGLTMWSWAHAGVSLPHSSWMQYQAIPHVSRSQLLPGDLVFFYSPISHVGIYVGNDMMIHAPHTGSVVSLRQFSTYPYFVGAGRPG